MTPQSRIEKVLAEIEYRETNFRVLECNDEAFQLLDVDVPALRKAVKELISVLAMEVVDDSCEAAKLMSRVAEILEGKE